MKLILCLFAMLLVLPCMAADRNFVNTWSDFGAAEKWASAELAATPPVAFEYNGMASDELEWVRSAEAPVTHTDYSLSDEPAERITRLYTYVCTGAELMLKLVRTEYPGFPVVEYDAELVNLSGSNSGRISRVASLDGSVLSGKATVHYNRGTTIPCSAIEYEPLTAEIAQGRTFSCCTVTGLPTQDYLPFFNVSGKSGGVVAAVNWQGSWFMEGEYRNGKVCLRAGQRNMDLVMLPHETLRLPGTVLMFYKGNDWQQGQNLWRRWIIKHNLFRHTGRRCDELVYLASPLNQTLEDDLRAMDNPYVAEICKRYFTTMEYDYSGVRGWFDCTRMNWGETGDWNPAPDYKGSEGLKQISEKCRSVGMGLCFWIEPERCYEGTDTEKALGDEAVLRNGPLALVNMGTKKAENYLFRLTDSLINDFGLTLYRQDFNIANEPFWSDKDKSDEKLLGIPRNGATENHACTGYLKLWSRLAEKHPGMLFDSCASGGRRNDLETMRYSFMHTKTDYWAFTLPQQCQNFGCNMWYIFTGSVLYGNFSKYDIRSRLSLSVGLDINPINEKTLEVLEEWSFDHKYLMKDYYTLTDYDLSGDENMAVQFNDYEDRRGILIAYLRNGGAFSFVCMGLDPGQHYAVTDRDDPAFRRVMTGKDMMDGGVLVIRDRRPQAPCLEYTATDEPVTPFDDAAVLAESKIEIPAPFEGSNDMKALKAEYKKHSFGDKTIKYVGADFDTSGGIYGVSRDFYDRLPFTGITTADGWRKLDPSGLYLDMDVERQLTIWPEGGYFDVRAYAKEEDGCCFVWLDNTFTFGDFDGAAKTEERRFGIGTPEGVYWSDKFVLEVSEWDKPGGRRAIQYLCYDTEGTGTVYTVDPALWECLPASGTETEHMGMSWTPLVFEKCYFVISDENVGKLTLYKGRKDDRCFLWIQNSTAVEMSDAVGLYYTNNGVRRRSVFYFIGRRFRSSLEPLPAIGSL